MFRELFIKSFVFPKFCKSPVYFFSSNKKNIKPTETLVKPLWNNIFKRLQGFADELEDLEDMGKENPDQETLQFINDEQMNYRNLLEELEEKAIEFLIPVSRWDDCMNVDIEIRPGFYLKKKSFF